MDPRSAKARLFGDESSDRLHKQVIKARLLRELQHPTGGIDTHDEGAGSTEPSVRAQPIEPVRVGRYAVLRKLGQGGMGVVYVGFDEDLDRKVAIKLLRGDLTRDERGRARMLREAQALARLSHPNVVQVHEIGRWTDHDYVAMEYVEGLTFDRWVCANQRSWQAILEVMLQAGRGLEAAHAAKLVHRDFKPANLLVGRDGRARVLDFGLARATTDSETAPPINEVLETVEFRLHEHARSDHDTNSASDSSSSSASNSFDASASASASNSAFDKLLTVTGAVLGTPAYMAPEQHLGQPATALSDQFSFCVVLFEALFGERPFKGKSRTEYAVHVAEGEIELPAGSSGVPAWLRRVIVRGLDPNPTKRWPSMAALLAELGRDRTRNWRRVSIAAGLFVAVGAALAVNATQPQICEFDGRSVEDTWGATQRDAVRQAFTETKMIEADVVFEHTVRSLNRYTNDLLAGRAEACEARWVARSQSDAQLALRNACLEQRERELGAVVGVLIDADRDVVLHAPELLSSLGDVSMCARIELLEAGTPVPKDVESIDAIATVREMIVQANAARDVGRVADARALTAEAWRVAEQVSFEPLIGELHNLESRNARLARNIDEARQHLRAAISIARRNGTLELEAQAWGNLALLAAESGVDPDTSLEFELAVTTTEQLGSPRRHLALLSLARGLALLKAGKPTLALSALDRALSLAEAGFIGSERLLSDILVVRASAHASIGHAQDARADLERVVLARGTQSSAQIDALFNLAIDEIQAAEFDDGARDMKSAIRGYEMLFGPQFEAIGHGHLALGDIALKRNEIAAAEQSFNAALAILDENHADHDWALDGLASAQLRNGRYDAAEQTLRRALAHNQRAEDVDSARVAYLRGQLGVALREGGALEDAIDEFDRAILYLEQIDAPLDLATVLLGRGQTMLAQDQPQMALVSLERAVKLAPIDCGVAWLAGEARVALAEALHRLDIRKDEQRLLAREATQLLRDIPSSAKVLEFAVRLSGSQPTQPEGMNDELQLPR